jgi:hypothetical protein
LGLLELTLGKVPNSIVLSLLQYVHLKFCREVFTLLWIIASIAGMVDTAIWITELYRERELLGRNNYFLDNLEKGCAMATRKRIRAFGLEKVGEIRS